MSKEMILGAEELKAKVEAIYASGTQGMATEVAKLANMPYDAEVAIPDVISKICRVERVEKGEDFYYFTIGAETKTVYTISSGSVTQANVSITSENTLTFNSYNGPAEYVYLEALMGGKYDPIAFKTKVIMEALNRKEIKDVLDVALASASGSSLAFTLDTGDTAFDFPKAEEMVRALNKYATKFILVAGNTVASDIALMNYNANKFQAVKLSDLGIQEVVTVPTFQYAHSGTQTVLAATKAVLVAVADSNEEKAIIFVRRKIQDVFSGGGDKERVVVVSGPRIQVGSNPKWGYEVAVMEQYGVVQPNPFAVASFERV